MSVCQTELVIAMGWCSVTFTAHRTTIIMRPCKNRKCFRQESNLVFDLRRVACVPAHSENNSIGTLKYQVTRPGIEPGPGTARRVVASEAVMRSSTLTSQIVSTPTWTRTRTKTLGESCAVRYTIGTKSRRLDLHQHHPVYKTGAFLSRATSAKSKRVTDGS